MTPRSWSSTCVNYGPAITGCPATRCPRCAWHSLFTLSLSLPTRGAAASSLHSCSREHTSAGAWCVNVQSKMSYARAGFTQVGVEASELCALKVGTPSAHNSVAHRATYPHNIATACIGIRKGQVTPATAPGLRGGDARDEGRPAPEVLKNIWYTITALSSEPSPCSESPTQLLCLCMQ